MENKEEGWVRYVPVLIAILAVLTAFSAYASSDLSIKGQDDLNEATRWAIFAANAYSSHWVEGSLSHFAREMAEAWYDIANYTGDEADLIQAQHWQKLANEKKENAKEKFDLYTEKIEKGVRPLRESGIRALTKASQFTTPIIFFQVSATLLVVTQLTRRKVLLVFSLGLTVVGIAYLLPLFI